jgi:hypothetical protein
MLHLVRTERVYPPETVAAMAAAFDYVCESIPKSATGTTCADNWRRSSSEHVDRGVQEPERLSDIAFREFAGLNGSASER